MATYSGECLHLFVREKRKWKKYPCCVRDGYFIQFKDGKVLYVIAVYSLVQLIIHMLNSWFVFHLHTNFHLLKFHLLV